MKARDPKWCHPWPPTYASFPSDHINLIKGWLSKSQSYRSLSTARRSRLANVVLVLDHTAWRMAQELAESSISIDELRDQEFARVKPNKRMGYLRAISKVNCIDSCEATRQALFCGDWGAAVECALFVGRNEVGDFATVGRATIYAAKGPDRLAKRSTIRQSRASVVLAKGRALLAANPELTRKQITARIQDAHQEEPGFDKRHMIYRELKPLFSSRTTKKR